MDDILCSPCLSDSSKKVYETVKSRILKHRSNLKFNHSNKREGKGVDSLFTDLATLPHGILHLWRALQ